MLNTKYRKKGEIFLTKLTTRTVKKRDSSEFCNIDNGRHNI